MTRYAFAVDDAATVTQTLTEKLDGVLFNTPLTLFRALHQIAVEVAAAAGMSAKVTEVEFFCPVEAVALALSCHPATVHRALGELKVLGLIDERGHYTTLNGRTRADGAVFAVRLRPLEGRRARLSYHALKRQYRSLSADIRDGRTVWAAMRESKENPTKSVNLDYIRRFALPPTDKAPVAIDRRTTPRTSLEALLDVTEAKRDERRSAVDLAAQALSTALRDSSSLNYFRRLLWQLLRRYDASGQDCSYQVYLMAKRAAVDASEGFARRPGALFVSRLKASGLLAEMMNAPPNRVAALKA